MKKTILTPIKWEYWVKNGYSEEDAKNKVSEIQIERGKKNKEKYKKDPASMNWHLIEFWTRRGYSEEEAKKKIIETNKKATINFITQKNEYWVNRGYSEEDAKNKVSEIQIERGKKNKGNKNCGKSNRIQYWVDKGYTNIEAYEIIKQNSQFTLEKCIKKHGEKEGTKKYKDRQEKWINTMKSKPIDEQMEIYKKKLKRSKFYSDESIKIFNLLLDDLIKEISFNYDYFWKNNEFFLIDEENKQFYSYDFTIPALKIIIEYNGHHCHPNKKALALHEWNNWRNVYPPFETADEKYEKDLKKEMIAKNKGFQYLVIWSNISISEQLNDIKKIIIHEINQRRKTG